MRRVVVTLGVALSPLVTGALAHAAEVTEYFHIDAIGNVRLMTDAARAVVERHDYLPYGEECTTGGCTPNGAVSAGQPKRFTGKERDSETGLDYFGARFYGSQLGRFTTVDPQFNLRESVLNPQKWNRYGYTLGNPLRYSDPDGREEITITINAFIPGAFVTTPWPMKGDNRGLYEAGSSRTSETIVVETDARKNPNGFVSAIPETGSSLGLGSEGIRTPGKASTVGMNVGVSRNEAGDVIVTATGSVAYPNLPSAPIRYDLNISVSDHEGKVGVGVSGSHTRFPAFEVLAQREGSNVRQPVYGRTPGQSGVAPLGILTTMPATANKQLERQ